MALLIFGFEIACDLVILVGFVFYIANKWSLRVLKWQLLRKRLQGFLLWLYLLLVLFSLFLTEWFQANSALYYKDLLNMLQHGNILFQCKRLQQCQSDVSVGFCRFLIRWNPLKDCGLGAKQTEVFFLNFLGLPFLFCCYQLWWRMCPQYQLFHSS